MADESGQLTKPQLAALLKAAAKAGIPASRLSPKSPWLDESKTARSLQVALTAVAPDIAEELQRAAGAGAPLSLMATAYMEGVEGVDLTPELREELQIRRPSFYATEIRAKELMAAEARFLEGQQKRAEVQAALNAQIASQAESARIDSLNLIRLMRFEE